MYIELDLYNNNNNNYIVIPGFIDCHVHLCGGGGEAGPESRTPSAKFSELIESGVTTCIGILGTDGISRSPIDLLIKCRGLENEGITTYMWTGNYHIPVPTITNHIQKDILLIDKIIGVGELALSDHRGSQPTKQELIRIASDVHVAGILSKKAGIIHCHLGKHSDGLKLLFEIIDETPIPITTFHPTHVNIRGENLKKQCIKWLNNGGYVDITAGKSAAKCINDFVINQNINIEQITMSSDAYGSSPKYSNHGELIGYGYHTPKTLLNVIKELVINYSWNIEKAISLITKNPAKYLKLSGGKGEIDIGHDADLLVIDKNNFKLIHVIAGGQLCMKDGKIMNHGFFTPSSSSSSINNISKL